MTASSEGIPGAAALYHPMVRTGMDVGWLGKATVNANEYREWRQAMSDWAKHPLVHTGSWVGI